VYLAGLNCGLASMLLLIVSQFFESDTSIAFPVLLVATAFLGAGFGLTVPALNTLTAAFHTGGVESSVLVLNALLGLATALAPVFVAIFVGLGFCWGLPVMSAILLAALVVVSLGLPLPIAGRTSAQAAAVAAGIPRRFWMYAAFALLCGICETVNGNWSQLDMTRELGASATVAAIALTAFWAMVTVGRVVFAAVDRWLAVTHDVPHPAVSPRRCIRAHRSPAARRHRRRGRGVRPGGPRVPALLPLTIGFGEKELAAIAAALAGGVIAFYQLGYGMRRSVSDRCSTTA
jgi:hypothetical protein